MATTPRTSPEIGGWAIRSSARRTRASSAARASYVDDIELPGMLYMDIVRSPFAHAKIKKIDTDRGAQGARRAGRHHRRDPGQFKLHWMPTLMSDTQMVLPTEKVMYQAQEVAAVDRNRPLRGGRRRGGGRSGLRPAAGHGRSLQGAGAWRAGAAHRQDRQEGQPHLPLGSRRPRGYRPGDRQTPRWWSSEHIYIPRIHVASIETCGCVADFDA